MKSGKQRRQEIKRSRVARADAATNRRRQQEQRDLLGRPGTVLADREILAAANPRTCAELPEFYRDRPYVCRDCGVDEIWTAGDQKWWYETIGARLDSVAVRCGPCRRAHRELRAEQKAHPGANRLGEEIQRLRTLGDRPPTRAALAEIDTALTSKWWGHRQVAIATLGRWGTPEAAERLRAIIAAGDPETLHWPEYGRWENVAARAAAAAL